MQRISLLVLGTFWAWVFGIKIETEICIRVITTIWCPYISNVRVVAACQSHNFVIIIQIAVMTQRRLLSRVKKTLTQNLLSTTREILLHRANIWKFIYICVCVCVCVCVWIHKFPPFSNSPIISLFIFTTFFT